MRRLATLILGSLVLAGVARADAPPPSALERTIPVEIQPGSTAPVLVVPKPPAPSSTDNRPFTLGAVNIDGATVFSQQQLSRHFEPYLATEVNEATLRKIADAITADYRQKGYILSYATVPAQNVEAGMVRLQVTEGRVGDIVISGAGPVTPALKAIAAPLVKQGALRRSTLERALGLMRDLPGLKIVDVALVQSDVAAGVYTLKITTVRSRIHALAYFDNRGIAGMGRARLFASAAITSVVKAGDELRVDAFGMPGDRSRYVYGQVLASTPIGVNGLRLSLSASRGNQYLRSGEHFNGRSDTLTAELGYPLLRSRELSLIAKASLSDSLTVGTVSGTKDLRDHLRVARMGVSFMSEGRTQLLGDFIVSTGLGFPGATKAGDPLASRPGASGKFTKVSLSMQLARAITDRFTLRATALGQYADRPLLSAEEFSLGGNRVGRAFAFNTLTGARGAGAGLELGYRVGEPKNNGQAPEIFGFADGGFAHTLLPQRSGGSEQSLSSAGAGVRFTIAGISASLETGIPLSGSTRHSPRYYVTLLRAL